MSTNVIERPKLHSIHEVSQTLGISRSVVTRIIMTSGIVPISLGRVTMINDSDLGVLRIALVAEGFEVQS